MFALIQPGETLDPPCGPQDIDCQVSPPAMLSVTNLEEITNGSLTFVNETGTLSVILPGAAGQVLTISTSGLPSWGEALDNPTWLASLDAGKITGYLTSAQGGTGINTSGMTGFMMVNSGDWSVEPFIPVAMGGTGTTSFVPNGVLLGSGSSILQSTNAPETGQVLIADFNGIPTFTTLDTSFVSEGGDNYYFTDARFDNSFSSKATTDLIEGTNLYYSDSRARNALSVISSPLTYDSSTGDFSITPASAVSEGYLSQTDWNTFNSKEDAIATGANGQYYRGDKTWAILDTFVVPENGNVYWTQGRFDAALTEKTTDNLTEGLTNLYYSNSRFDNAFASKTTDQLTEGGAGLYFTQARFDNALAGKSTTNLVEGLNQYWTSDRFNTAFALKSTTDIIEGTNLYYSNSRFDASLASKSSDNLSGGVSNLYYSDSRARNALSVASSPLAYDSGTGVFGITPASAINSGYLSQTDWNAFNSKMGSSLGDGLIWVGNASNTAVPVALSGDATLSSSGEMAIPDASGTARGLVTTGAQTFAGNKTFTGGLRFAGSVSGYVELAAAAASDPIVYTLPASDGTDGQVLATNGAGALSWGTVTGGGGSGLWSQTGNDIYYTDGKVGIGTMGPIKTLHIIGNSLIDANIAGVGAGSTHTGMKIISGGGTNDGTVRGLEILSTIAGATGIGDELTGLRVEVGAIDNNGVTRGLHIVQPNQIGGSPGSYITDLITADGIGGGRLTNAFRYRESGADKFVVTANGFVGIGTGTPTAALHIIPSMLVPAAMRIDPYGTESGNTGELRWQELLANGSNYTGFKSPDALGSDIVYTLPASDGTDGQVLATNGAGSLSWATASGGGSGDSFILGGNSSGGLAILGTNDNYGLAFETNGVERMRFDTDGSILMTKGTLGYRSIAIDPNIVDGMGGTLVLKAGDALGENQMGGNLALVAGIATGMSPSYISFAASKEGLTPGSSQNLPNMSVTISGSALTLVGGMESNTVTQLRFQEGMVNTSGGHFISFQSPEVLADNVIYTLPSADGTNGQILSTNSFGGLSWVDDTAGASDVRLKENIVGSKTGISDLKKIQVRDFNFKDNSETVQGFIAQELYDVYGQAVFVGSDDRRTDGTLRSPWKVNYGALTPLIVKSIQEQQEVIEELQKNNNSLSSSDASRGITVLSPDIIDELQKKDAITFFGNITVKGESVFEKMVTFASSVVLKTKTTFEGMSLFLAEAVFKDNVLFEGRVTFASDNAGYATIKSGQKQVEVTFERSFEEAPIITVSLRSGVKLDWYRATAESKSGFIIEIDSIKDQDQDIEFAWTAIAVKNARTATSGVTEVIITPSPEISQETIPELPATSSLEPEAEFTASFPSSESAEEVLSVNDEENNR